MDIVKLLSDVNYGRCWLEKKIKVYVLFILALYFLTIKNGLQIG